MNITIVRSTLTSGLFLFFLFIIRPVMCQENFNVLDWRSNTTVHTYLMQEVHRQYDKRDTTFSRAVESRAGMLEYRDRARERYLEILGEMPESGDLNPVLTGSIEAENYKIEKVIFESFPGHHVTSNLYTPSGSGPFPAALFFCGHEPTAKATVSYQKTAALLAMNGFVVLVIDPISQGERHQLTDAEGKALTRGGTTEHTLLNAGANLLGTGTVAWELWDNVRSLDYLLTRPEVDPERIGCLGNSGGGTQTTYFMAYEDRIKLAAPCSYISSRERNLELGGASDGCQHIVSEGKEMLEIADFMIMAAPKPLLILAGKYDFVDIEGALLAFDEMKKVYRALGSEEKAELFVYPDGHGITRPKREIAVSWFRRWFYDDPSPVIEGEITTFSPEELACTPQLSVNAAFPDEINVQDMQEKMAMKSAEERPEINANELVRTMEEILQISAPDESVSVEKTGSFLDNGIRWQKMILRKPQEIPLPALMALPSDTNNVSDVLMWFPGKGKVSLKDSTEIIKDYLDRNTAVIVADLSGIGETEDDPYFNPSKYYNSGYRNIMTALHTGKPLISQQVQNIFAVIDFVKNNDAFTNASLKIRADRLPALAVLHASVLKQGIDEIELDNRLNSFTEIIQKPTEKEWYGYVIPSVLNYYDVDDLINYLESETTIKLK